MLRHDYSLPEKALGFGTTLTLGILAVTSLGLRYVTNPISCWVPDQFPGALTQYSHDVCFQKTAVYRDTIHEDVSMETPKPQNTYHQWVPFALGVGAILCLLPHAVWRMLSGLLWLDAHALAQTLADNQRHNAGRHVMLKDSALVVLAGLRGGNWQLAAAALARKMLACAVCVLQLILIVVLFKPQLSALGEEDEKGEGGRGEEGRGEGGGGGQGKEEEERDFNASLPLPEHFMCNFEIPVFQSVQSYTIPCMFPLAQVYNKGFAFLFYLFVLLALGCLLDLFTCVGRLAIPGLRDASLRRYLAVSDPGTDPQTSAVTSRFLDSLGMDGRLLVAVTAEACGPVAAADLTQHLWMTFRASSRPGAVLSDPNHGPASGVVMTTVPPAHYAAPAAPAAPGPVTGAGGVMTTVPPAHYADPAAPAAPGPVAGAGVVMTTVPPVHYTAPGPEAGAGEALPLLPMGGTGAEMKGAQA